MVMNVTYGKVVGKVPYLGLQVDATLVALEACWTKSTSVRTYIGSEGRGDCPRMAAASTCTSRGCSRLATRNFHGCATFLRISSSNRDGYCFH